MKELEKKQEKTETDFPLIKLTFLVLFFSLGVFLLWAAFYPLRQGAPAHGVVVVSGYRKVHQHPYGGVIKEILVKEGDFVQKGQPLIIFEDTEIKAQFMQARVEYLSLSLQKARLLAEKSQQSLFTAPKEFASYFSDPEFIRIYQAQRELFQARRVKLENEKRLLQETISGLTEYIVSLKNQYRHLQSQLDTLEKQISSLAPLTEAGFYPRNRLLDLQRQAEATRAQLAEIIGNIKRAETSLREAKQRLNLLEREYQKDLEAELAEVEKRLLMVKESYTSLLDRLEKTTLRAQETGR
ncbi:MAG: biotin/lipoyl-binding protein, partial [Nanopusillaceae archaeon]